MDKKFIIVYINSEGEISKVGLYRNMNNPKWLKWLSKKNYKFYANVNNIEIFEVMK